MTCSNPSDQKIHVAVVITYVRLFKLLDEYVKQLAQLTSFWRIKFSIAIKILKEVQNFTILPLKIKEFIIIC